MVAGEYVAEEAGYQPYSFDDKETGNICLAAVYTQVHMKKEDPDHTHCTCISYDPEHGFMVWCGDRLLDGQLSAEELDERMDKTFEDLPEGVRAALEPQIRDAALAGSKSAACSNHFHKKNLDKWLLGDKMREGAKIACPHVSNMFALTEDMEKVAKQLVKNYNNYKKVAAKSLTGDPIVDALTVYGFRGESFFIAGPGGHGKTHTVKSYALENDFNFVEVQGHAQIEALDLYGYVSVDDEGNKGWLDGPISQAARKAAKGEKTVLFIDEFLNIPMRETAGMKAPFEPYKGHYYINTGRNVRGDEGLLVQEQLKVPVENLLICAAANIGSGYASESFEKALKQRFQILYYEAPLTKVKTVLLSIAKEKGFTSAVVDKLMAFHQAMGEYLDRGAISDTTSLRHLSRKILELCEQEEDLPKVAVAQALQFVDFDDDGKPIAEELEMVLEAIEDYLE